MLQRRAGIFVSSDAKYVVKLPAVANSSTPQNTIVIQSQLKTHSVPRLTLSCTAQHSLAFSLKTLQDYYQSLKSSIYLADVSAQAGINSYDRSAHGEGICHQRSQVWLFYAVLFVFYDSGVPQQSNMFF